MAAFKIDDLVMASMILIFKFAVFAGFNLTRTEAKLRVSSRMGIVIGIYPGLVTVMEALP